MKHIAYIIFLLSEIALSAQPGYMGKKISLSYQFEATPFFSFMTIGNTLSSLENEGDDDFWMKIVQGHHAAVGLVLNRKTELIGRIGVRTMTYRYFTFHDANYNYYESKVPTFIANEVMIDFGFRHYFKDHIAPTGSYHQLTIGQSTASVADKSKEIKFRTDGYDFFEDEATVYQEQIQVTRFSYGIGTKKIITNGFFCSVDFDIHFTLSAPEKYYRPKGDSSYQVPVEDYSLACLTQNFSTYKRYTLLFGLGILL